MRKIVRILMAAVLVAASAFGMAACSEKEYEATTVGAGHIAGGSLTKTVIETTVVVDAKKNIVSVHFDEVMAVDSVTTASIITSKVAAGLKVNLTNSRGTADYCKYVVIDGVAFEVTDNEGTYTDYVEITENATKRSIVTLSKTDDGAKWYYDAVKANKCFIGKLDTDGETVVADTTIPFKYTEAKGMFKRDSGYWSGTNYPLGIKGNYEKLEAYLLAYGFDKIPTGTWTADATSKQFKDTAGVSTEATMVDTPAYVKVAKAAYEAACAKIA